MQTLNLQAAGLMMNITSDDNSDLTWLLDFFGFMAAPRGREQIVAARRQVELRSDEDLLEGKRNEIAGSGERSVAFILDTEVIELPSCSTNQKGMVAFDKLFGTAYHWVDPSSLAIYDAKSTGAEGRRARGALMRVVREMTMDHLWRTGTSFLHASAFSVGGRGVLICGNKCAGKSSLLSASLLGLPGAELLSNDRVALTPVQATLLASPLPTVVSIRMGSLAVVPGLSSRLQTLDHDYTGQRFSSTLSGRSYRISPVQMAEALGVPLASQTTVSAIVFPQIDPNANSPTLRKLDEDESFARIRRSAFATDHLGKHTEFFAIAESGSSPVREELLSRLSDATTELSCYELTMGPSAYRPDNLRHIFDPLLS